MTSTSLRLHYPEWPLPFMSDHSSVLIWLNGLPPSSAQPPDSRPSKRPAPQDFPHAPIAPALRRSSKRLKALQETSGNAMPLPQPPQQSNLNETQTTKPLATRGRQPATTIQPSLTPSGQAKRRQGRASRKQSQEQEQDQSELDGEEQEEATPRPVKRSGRVLDKLILPRPSADGDSTESSANSNKSGASSKRGGSPVKPTRPYHIDAKSAREIGGVLDKYKRLREISMGIGVIPQHLKASARSLSDYNILLIESVLLEFHPKHPGRRGLASGLLLRSQSQHGRWQVEVRAIIGGSSPVLVG